MRIRWWQSIRWRLALGSVLLALLTTSSLALTAIFVVGNYYTVEQKAQLSDFASTNAPRIGEAYVRTPAMPLNDASQQAMNSGSATNEQARMVIVFNKNSIPVYTNFKLSGIDLGTSQAQATADPTITPQKTVVSRSTTVAHATNVAKATEYTRKTRNKAIEVALLAVNPSIKQVDIDKFQVAVVRALYSPHQTTDDEFGRNSPLGNAQPYSVRPIFNGEHTIGALVVTMRPEVIPVYVSNVGAGVFFASFVVALIAALLAIAFSQTITRPMVKIAQATRMVAAGDYDVRVTTKAPGELSELAHNFNEMAAQLKLDVEELRRQEEWRRELIMNVTHDLATPLTAIAGLGESLMDGVNQTREDYEITGRVIMNETLRLRRLVQDLHVMAKVEAGALQPSLKVLRLAALVDEMLAVQATEFERHLVEPANNISYSLPMIMADHDMLMRVFSNLCNNALRHTPVYGRVAIDAVVRENMMVVSVTDTGEGIAEEALQRIFERFYRADSARQSATGGSGLGLAIVQAIIGAHGGTIWAENVVGAGARLSFTLPINKQIAVADAPTLSLPLKYIRSGGK